MPTLVAARQFADLLEPMNDIMEPIVQQNGAVNGTVKYLGQPDGKWLAVPATIGSQIKGPCSRIDLMKKYANIDVQEMYPAGSPPKADNWTTGYVPEGGRSLPQGRLSLRHRTRRNHRQCRYRQARSSRRSVQNSSTPRATSRSRPTSVRQALEFYKKLISFLPPDVAAWDDASNNKWLISGKGAMIMNPPSAWAVAKRDAPQVAEQCWTHGFPVGPKGRFAPYLPFFWSVWNFSKNKEAAKSLLTHLSQPTSIEKIGRSQRRLRPAGL